MAERGAKCLHMTVSDSHKPPLWEIPDDWFLNLKPVFFLHPFPYFTPPSSILTVDNRQGMAEEELDLDSPCVKMHFIYQRITFLGNPLVTSYHSKFIAYDLTRRLPLDSAERLAGAVVDAQVDPNPHQIDAALFAFSTPLSRGAILADEVGLGKTIEAGLVISQRWAENRRKLLVITPSNLRKQWHQELTEKFFLPCRILETKAYNEDIKQKKFRPFLSQQVVICSYQFARAKAADVHAIQWDLVVIDEAHRLRNVYKPSNIIANTLKGALEHAPKLLLTATPLQNSLLELFGLVSFVDEHTFGDLTSFKEQFLNLEPGAIFRMLQARLRPICHRTLRRQVLPYIKYTKRYPILEHFTPSDSEDQLYNLVSEYLGRPNLYALPSSQRGLITLVLRKLLASSSFAIAGALQAMITRLQDKIEAQLPPAPLADELEKEYEALDSMADEAGEEEAPEPLSDADIEAIKCEIEDLERFRNLAVSIERNAKGDALLKALGIAFAKAEELGAPKKAIIFTESRRTQDYLLRVLADSPWKDGIVLFNGSNTDVRSKAIYAEWFERNKDTDRITGSKTADMRSALVDYFRDQGRIMIATEAGAEGINLQFCALVVNYDLPWNPQRIEQRIGRCHRYGQMHDVVVVNFLNSKNEADQHVFRLLAEKFRIFEGVFGASDEILGAIESGVDFERRIAAIYQECRRSEDIQQAFEVLQRDLEAEISDAMTNTRQKLLEHFDDEVRDKLKIRDEETKAYIKKYEQLLMDLTRFELAEKAEFQGKFSFRLQECPFPDMEQTIPLGLYELPRRSGDAHLYRMTHPLAMAIFQQARERVLPTVEITLKIDEHVGKISILDPIRGSSGWLSLSLFSVGSLDQQEDHLIFSTVADNGAVLDEEIARKLLSLPGHAGNNPIVPPDPQLLDTLSQKRRETIQGDISKRNGALFEAEAMKLDGWAEDLKLGLEREIKEIDRQIREIRRTTNMVQTLEEKVAGHKKIKVLESIRSQKRKTLFEAQDAVDQRRQEMIDNIEKKLNQTLKTESIFTIKWKLE